MAVSFAAVAIALPGRSRRLPGLLLVGVGVGLARAPLLAVYHYAGAGGVPARVGHAAGRAALLAALGVGIAWAVVVVLESRVTAADPGRAGRLRRAGSAVLAVLLLGAVIGAGASAPRIEHTVSSQWRAFTHLSENGDANSTIQQPGQSRLLSGGGYRYDYWRIAWNAWRADPVIGIGAGNYDRVYFARRATPEDIRQPHSIELQALSELGLVGGALLLALVVGAVAGVRRMRAEALASPRTLGLLVAALGVSVSWFAQTSVDWMHLRPGVTAVALAAIAVLVSGRSQPDGGGSAVHPRTGTARVPLGRRRRGGRTADVFGGAVVAGALVLAGASLSRQGLADLYRSRAQSDLAANPRGALREANRSLSFDPDAVASYYAKAAALARFDDAAAARDALRAALGQEPHNFVTWTLLGDIAVRQGRLRAAQADYVRALALNPRDSSLAALAANPRAAVP
jgi:tetratricopeptide (TPR) repeat protein